MELISLEQWKAAAVGVNCLPYARRYANTPAPSRWRPYLANGSAILLESARDGRYTSYIPEPKAHYALTEASLAADDATTLDWLRNYLSTRRMPRFPALPPFCGGLVGCLSYDVAREIEQLPTTAQDDLGLPRAAFAVADDLLVFDHEAGTLDVITVSFFNDTTELEALYQNAAARTETLYRDFVNTPQATPTTSPAPTPQATPTLSLDRASYVAAVNRVQEYIAAGDSYQVNLSLRESRALTADPSAIYECLRRINPSPYMAYLPFGDWTLVCGSPELLVKSYNGIAEARPIAGSRPRGACDESDAALGGELLAHPKERAEHLMLVDLIRNDLGRVCQYGSVEVTDFMVLEGYSHVQHIVSHVVGQLDNSRDEIDLIASAFPGGTITGAPKVRTMEIIEELEPVRRGFYTGSIGWLGYTGDTELNIVIRTLLAKGGLAHVQAGAGIVADSVPEHEFEESLNKARALWAALEQATESHAHISR